MLTSVDSGVVVIHKLISIVFNDFALACLDVAESHLVVLDFEKNVVRSCGTPAAA